MGYGVTEEVGFIGFSVRPIEFAHNVQIHILAGRLDGVIPPLPRLESWCVNFYRQMARYVSKQAQFGHLWWEEMERYEYDQDDWCTVDCAELADELSHHEIAATADPDYESEYDDWAGFIYENYLMLVLEQSSHQGMLLPTGQRAIRLESCPEDMLRPLRWFFELCPSHVKSRLVLDFSLLVRIDRARRTGNPDWSARAQTGDNLIAVVRAFNDMTGGSV